MTPDLNQLLLDETPDALILLTLAGEVVSWNRGAERLFGFTAAEVVGRTLDAFIVPADRQAEEGRILEETLRTGFTTHESLRRKKDGSLIHVDVSSKTVAGADG